MQDVDSRTSSVKWTAVLSVGLCLELLIIALKGFWTESFWLDETITAWLAGSPWNEITERVLRFQGQSPLYYVLLHGWRGVFGDSELALRLPSLFLCVLSAAVFIAILKQLGESQQSTLFALIILLSLDQFHKSFSARPYALALFFSVLSTYFLVHALKRENRSFLSWGSYTVSLCATFYSHYLFAAIIAAQAGVVFFWKDHGKFRAWLISLILALLSFFPGIVQLHLLSIRQSEVEFLPPLSSFQALRIFLPIQLVLYIIVPVALAAVITWKKGERFFHDIPRERLSASVWFAVSPFFVLLALSLVTGSSLLVDRYAAWGVFGMSFLAALVVCAIRSERGRAIAISLSLLLVISRELGRRWVIEDWRGISDRIKTVSDEDGVLVYSGLAEHQCTRCLISGEFLQYLVAPFFVYPVDDSKIFFPIAPQITEENAEFMTHVLRTFGEKGMLVLLERRLPDGTTSEESIIAYLQDWYELSPIHTEGPVRLFRVVRKNG